LLTNLRDISTIETLSLSNTEDDGINFKCLNKNTALLFVKILIAD